MYKPLDASLRPFAMATLTACILYDLKMKQLSTVVTVDFSSFMRSDVIVQELAQALGATEENVMSGSLYRQLITAAFDLWSGHVVTSQRNATYFAAIQKAVAYKDSPLKTTPPITEIAPASAIIFLESLENMVHSENKGNLSERVKRRVTARLRHAKEPAEPQMAPPDQEDGQEEEVPAPVQAVPHAPLEPEDEDAPLEPGHALRGRLARRIAAARAPQPEE